MNQKVLNVFLTFHYQSHLNNRLYFSLLNGYLQPPWRQEMETMFFTSPRSTVSHASFSPDAVNEHFNKSVLTSPSTASLGSKSLLLYLLLTVTGLPNARFSVTVEETLLTNFKYSLAFWDSVVFQIARKGVYNSYVTCAREII